MKFYTKTFTYVMDAVFKDTTVKEIVENCDDGLGVDRTTVKKFIMYKKRDRNYFLEMHTEEDCSAIEDLMDFAIASLQNFELDEIIKPLQKKSKKLMKKGLSEEELATAIRRNKEAQDTLKELYSFIEKKQTEISCNFSDKTVTIEFE